MTREDNRRLNALERHLQQRYTKAAAVVINRNGAALRSLARYEPPEHLPEVFRDSHRRQAIINSGIIAAASRELLICAVETGSAIEAESRTLFAGAYQNEVRGLNRQLAAAGIFTALRLYTRRDLDDIHASREIWRLVTPTMGFDTAGLISQLAADRVRGEYFYRRALARLGSTQASADRLMREFSDGVARGESVQQLTRRIQSVTNSSFSHARTIAKTECHRILTQGSYLAACQAAEEIGLPIEKVWHHTAGQDNPRVQHEKMHGVAVLLEKDFELPDGTLMKYPHDPQAPAYHLVNCGCAFSTRLAGINSEQREQMRAQQAEQRAATAEQRAVDNADDFDDNGRVRQQPQALSIPDMPEDGGALMEINVDANVAYDGGGQARLKNTLHNSEMAIKDLPHERGIIISPDGRVVNITDGGIRNVRPPAELVRDNIFTHNHPSGGCFLSPGDMRNIIKDNGREIRAVTRDGRYVSLARGSSGWDSTLDDAFNNALGFRDGRIIQRAEEAARLVHANPSKVHIRREVEGIVNGWLRMNASKYGATFTEGRI